jgi:hypothetical protein
VLAFAFAGWCSDNDASEGFWFSQLHLMSNLTGLFTYDGGIYWHWLVNTLLYAGAGALCATLLASAAGYARRHSGCDLRRSVISCGSLSGHVGYIASRTGPRRARHATGTRRGLLASSRLACAVAGAVALAFTRSSTASY